MDKPYSCTVYGVWQPEAEDSIFYYSGDTADLQGESVEEIKAFYDNLTFRDGIIKKAANVYCDSALVAVISPLGIAPPETAWEACNGVAASIALKNAQNLNVNKSITEAIQHGNAHEIAFFADPRISDWLGTMRENYQFSLFD